jgi:predicted permease
MMPRDSHDPLPLSRQKPLAADVTREIEEHLALRTEELIAAGYTAEAARAEAERVFGDVSRVEEECRTITRRSRDTQRREERLGALWLDLRFAARILRRSPAFALGAIVTLALGIGANTAIFSVVDGVLLRPLPFADASQLVDIKERHDGGGTSALSWPNFADWREQSRSFDGMSAYRTSEGTLLGADRPARIRTAAVSEDFFRVMRVVPVQGRLPSPDEHRLGAAPVAVVSHRFWQSHLGGAADLTARRLRADFDFQVIGVVPPAMNFPYDVDLWFPAELQPSGTSRTGHNFAVVGRLGPGRTAIETARELDALTERMRAATPADFDAVGVTIAPLQDVVVGPRGRPLLLLLAASALLLVAACTNLASSMLVRGTARSHELAIRAAIGAGRGRLIRQVFTESILIGALGCVAGVAVALVLQRMLLALAPEGLVPDGAAPFDLRIIGFAVLLSGGTAVLFGLLPALRGSSARPAEAMREGTRNSGSRGSRRLWSTLVAVEVALAVVLLAGSGLMIRSFAAITAIDPGFRPDHLLTTLLDLPESSYPTVEQAVAQHERLLGSIRSIPGVTAVGVGNRLPLENNGPSGSIQVVGKPALANGAQTGYAVYRVVSDGYFEAVGMRLLTGRFFTAADRAGSGRVAVVSRALAEREWPGESALGKELRPFGMDEDSGQDYASVVGVVDDIPHASLMDTRLPAVWYPVAQMPARAHRMSLVVRTVGDPASVAPLVRDRIAGVDPQLPIDFLTMDRRLAATIADRRFMMIVLVTFAGVALLLAGVGIFGVVAYTVAQRTREIGIRIALGAEPARVQRLVQGGAMGVIGVGLAVGGVGAVLGTRAMRAMLYEVEPGDPLTLLLAAVLLGAVGFVASWLPARRAARVDPVQAIRTE